MSYNDSQPIHARYRAKDSFSRQCVYVDVSLLFSFIIIIEREILTRKRGPHVVPFDGRQVLNMFRVFLVAPLLQYLNL
jgi:hypothetical protein